MNNGTNNFQNFIGISSLQKTLRNALIPTETTQQFIVKNGIIKEDELRGENRQILKDIMDDYYRGFISETLSSIDDIDWTSLFEKMEIQLKNGDNKDTLIKEQAEKRKAIYKKFADDDRFKNMFSAKLISDILPEFVIHNNNYSASEKEEKTQVIKLFSRFATSFKDYFKNRANCFSADDISSSSCHRIVNDNAEIFFSNALVYRRIVKNLSNDDINKISGDMKDSLKEMSLEEIYSYEKYGEFITQEGISFYNDICGKVNLFMNLYCQKNKENKNLYKLRKLHKQILCIADTSYEVPYKFESDEEVYQSVNGFLDNISSKHIVERLRKIGDNYNGYNLDKIYIVSKFYESVSQKTYRDWETINTALEIHYNNILPGNGKSKADKVKKAVKNDLQKSITEINELVSNYKLCPDDNIKAETYIHEISHILNNFEAQELKYNPEIHLVESELKASELKNVLDVIMNAFHWCSVFMTEELVDKDNNFYAELEEIYDEIYPVISLYNLVRNYVTQKPYSTKKIKLNFGIPTLADGWSKSKEYSNNAIILMRDNLYYLVGHHEAATNIVKDYRYTYDKYFLHMPITINFKANKTSFINDRILQYIAKEKDLHVIGIDRGERNLIYVSVIDTCGNIVEQKSFNIVNGYDYQIKLKQQEGARQIARKEWKEIGKIKEIKEGYLSLVIHEISKMVIKYNAIIAMEDLSYGFKKGRFKVERQVYQKFETMLINKLNYLVFKDISITENGGLLKGYQLTYIPEKLKNVGHQCGCIFYVPAAYTSKIDPTTGFVNIFKFKDLTVDAKREFIKKFDSIRYDSEKNLFCFTFDYNNFITQNTVMSKSSWSVYTYGVRIKRRFVNGRFSNESDTIDITKDMEKTLEMTDINWRDGHDLRQDIIDYEIVQHIFEIFKLTVQMRNSLSELEDRDYDRLISPVLNENNIFYDSAKAGDALPKDADANGAYCIALKGLYEIKQIIENWKENGKFSRDKLKISNKDWFDFIQNKRYL